MWSVLISTAFLSLYVSRRTVGKGEASVAGRRIYWGLHGGSHRRMKRESERASDKLDRWCVVNPVRARPSSSHKSRINLLRETKSCEILSLEFYISLSPSLPPLPLSFSLSDIERERGFLSLSLLFLSFSLSLSLSLLPLSLYVRVRKREGEERKRVREGMRERERGRGKRSRKERGERKSNKERERETERERERKRER